jgi:tellurite resistance protein TerC
VRLKYLHYGVAFILAFIGVKLVFHALHVNELPFINGGEHVEWVPEIGNVMSLSVIVGSMAVATIASLIAPSGDKKDDASGEAPAAPAASADDAGAALPGGPLAPGEHRDDDRR